MVRQKLPSGSLILAAGACLLLALPAFAASSSPAATASSAAAEGAEYPVLAMMPHMPQAGTVLEAGIVLRDLRRTREIGQHQVELARLTALGRSFYAPGVQKEAFGFDTLAEMEGLAALAKPDGGSVPVGLALFSGAQGPGAQLLLPVAPGFFERLDAALRSDNPPAWPGETDGTVLRISVGEYSLVGRVGEDGWLRIAPDDAMLLAPDSGTEPAEPLFGETMARWAFDSDLLVFVRGGGMAVPLLSGMITDPTAAQALQGLRSLVITTKWDGDKTTTMRMLLDSSQLAQIGPMLRKADLANSLAAIWGADATQYFSLSLPPAAVQMAEPMAQMMTAQNEIQVPEAVMALLGKLDGRLGYVSFGSPGDWALGLAFNDGANLKAALPALHDWVAQLAAKGKIDTRGFALEALGDSGDQAIHMSPGVGIEGVRLAGIGNVLVVVGQSSRLHALRRPMLDAVAGKAPVVAPSTLTKAVEEALARPAILQGYTVLGTDGAWLEYMAWIIGSAKDVIAAQGEDSPVNMPWIADALEHLPTTTVLGAFLVQLYYDVTLSADVDGSVLVIESLLSEI